MIRERAGSKTLLAVNGLFLQIKGTTYKDGKVHAIAQPGDLPVRGAGYEPSTTRRHKSQMISQQRRRVVSTRHTRMYSKPRR